MRCFKKAKIYVEGRGIITADMTFDRVILSIGRAEGEKIPLPDDALVLPGFIDEHIHGAGGADVMDGTEEALDTISETIAAEGVTGFLATTMTQSEEVLMRTVGIAGGYSGNCRGHGARLLGIHMEGPFISEKYAGAQNPRYISRPDVTYMEKLLAASGDKIKMVTLAPELPGAREIIAYLKGRGVTVSMGHTAASYVQVEEAVSAGARCVTHAFNAQSPFHHRETGAAGAAMLMDGIAAELICDLLHVSPPAVKLLQKCKSRGKIILISDAMRAKGTANGEYELGGQTVYAADGAARLPDGTLAGSLLKINEAVRNFKQVTGVSVEEAVDAATINPAVNLGLSDKYGSIREGKAADFAVVNNNFDVLYTLRDGNVIYHA